MKKVFRFENNQQYWDRRWIESGSDKDSFDNLDVYPIKYAEIVMKDKSAKAAELGAGLGRVLKHYHYQGFDITGLERSVPAVDKIKEQDPKIRILQGDVMALPFADNEFDVVMAFGLYHNLEHGIEKALAETARCLKPGGTFCISMRPDNLEMNLNELIFLRSHKQPPDAKREFHKILVKEQEFVRILKQFGMETSQIHRARNVSSLYRIPFLRAKYTNEAERRSKGYKLNCIGRMIDGILFRLFGGTFCNVLVYIGKKGFPCSG